MIRLFKLFLSLFISEKVERGEGEWKVVSLEETGPVREECPFDDTPFHEAYAPHMDYDSAL